MLAVQNEVHPKIKYKIVISIEAYQYKLTFGMVCLLYSLFMTNHLITYC